jgi:Tol biopolymer transport system component
MAVRRLFWVVPLLLWVSPRCALATTVERVSIATDGAQANGGSRSPVISADGRFVAFESWASNLVPGDENEHWDVFLHDRETGETVCVSATPEGAPGNGCSAHPSMTPDGRYIAFSATASDLVADDTNGLPDVFVHDRLSGETERLEVVMDGWEWEEWESPPWACWPAISADGRWVICLYGYPVGYHDVVAYDRETDEATRVSVASDGTRSWAMSPAAISADGRYVTFTSDHWYLVPEPYWWDWWRHVFVHDRGTGETTWESVSSSGVGSDENCLGPAISGDGQLVAFASKATTLVSGIPEYTSETHVYLRERETGETTLADVALDGTPANHYALEDTPTISEDGRYVLFGSTASNLVPGTPTNEWGVGTSCALYLRDRARGRTSCLSITEDGTFADGGSAAISADGRYVVFVAAGPDLVPDDTNEVGDIFVRDRVSFEDVPLDHWAFYEIGGCEAAGVVSGYSEGRYSPEITVSRDQMAVFISRGMAGGDVHVPTGPAEASFPDVPTDYWAYDYVEYAEGSNVVQGYSDGNYHPDWLVSRGQMSVFVARAIVTPTGEEGLADYDPPDLASFWDVPDYYWCYTHVEYLAEHGIVSGYWDGSYEPVATVTRDQMAVYMQRAFQLPI